MAERVWVVVLNWNNGSDTIECLESVLAAADPAVSGIVLCDNASTDDSVLLLKKWALQRQIQMQYRDWIGGKFVRQDSIQSEPEPKVECTCLVQPAIVFLQTGANLGFAGGNNVGLRYLQLCEDFDFAFLLNNDALLTPGSASAMVTKMRAAKGALGFCGCTVVYNHTPDRVQAWGGATFQPYLSRSRHLGAHELVSVKPIVAEVCKQLDYIIGAAMMVSRPCLERVGLMEERYFLYFEEIDWCTRAKRAGFELGFAPDALVFHKEGGSIGSSSDKAGRSLLSEYYMVKSALKFTSKFYPYFLPTVIAFLSIKTVQALFRLDGRRALVRLRAMIGLSF